MTTEQSSEESLAAEISASAVDAESTVDTGSTVDAERRQTRLEARLAHAEAQIQTLQERMMEINSAQGSAKQRALWARVFILVALLGAFFVMQYLKGAG